MSFSTALSGLNAASADLNVKSNNIANVNTTGFKQSRAEFGDVFAVSAFGTSSKTAIGNGAVLQNVAQQFNQGNLEFTDNALDLAISGEGFFAMAPSLDSGEIIYTRAGEFGINKDGYMVNSEGSYLRTFPVDEDGIISATSMTAAKPLQLPASAGAPEPTTLLTIATNLPSNAEGISDTSSAADATSGYGTFDATSLLIDYSSETVSFDVSDGTTTTTVTLSGDYSGAGGLSSLLTDISGVLGSDFTVSNPTGNNVVITSALTGSTTGVGVSGFDADADGNTTDSTLTAFPTVTITNGTNAVLPLEIDINPLDPSTYTNSTSATVYDSLGNEHIVTTYYQKIDSEVAGGSDNQWKMVAYISADDVKLNSNSRTVTDGATTLVQLGNETSVSFNSDGTLAAVDGDLITAGDQPVEFIFNAANGTELASGAADQTVTLSLADSTQNSGAFSVGALTVNGFPTGRLTGVDISEEGLIRATYSNGQAIPIGKIALGNFANVQALNKIGNTSWKETTDSGPVIAGEAGTGSFGQIQSGALETSNVDLTKELVGLITAQRNFQANSKAIETNNAITQTIINLR
jgi:flagellar hook protein FlgE